MVYAVIAIALNAVVCAISGNVSVGVLIIVYFLEAPMYPTIFTLGTANLGRHTRRGAGILVMGVSGGAVFPPIQGAIADAAGTRISFVVPLVGFVYVLGYVTFHWLRTGRHVLRVKDIVAEGIHSAAVGGAVVDVHYDGDKEIKYEEAELSRSS
jgi:FHS family L-fucose permease-like MFS transporter